MKKKPNTNKKIMKNSRKVSSKLSSYNAPLLKNFEHNKK